MRTVATFVTDAFNTSEERPYFSNPGNFGDDLARWIMSRLAARSIQTAPEPGQEDHGWYFDFSLPEGDHCLVLGFRPADGDDPAVWVAWLERRRGFVASLFGGRKRGISPAAVQAVHGVLAGAEEVSCLRWHTQEDFDRGEEVKGVPTP